MSSSERFTIRPASHTKDVSLLKYPLNPLHPVWHNVHLRQLQALSTQHAPATDEQSTGTTLWLSAQLLTLHLLDTFTDGVAPSKHGKQGGNKTKKKQKAVDLGAGIGLTSLVLASLGVDVVATDLPVVIDQVLGENINDNRHVLDAAVSQEMVMYPFARDRVRSNELGFEAGRIDVKVLDWTADSETWRWDVEGWISPSTLPNSPPKAQGRSHIQPPFDLIVTSDTMYEQELILPLLRTLYQLSILGQTTLGSPPQAKKNPHPLILLSLERRDSDIVDWALQQARDMGFECKMVRARKIAKLMKKAQVFCQGETVQDPDNSGHDSEPDFQPGPIMQTHAALGEWDGVEIWKLQLKLSINVNTGALGL